MKKQVTKLVSFAALLAVAVLPTSCSKDDEVINTNAFTATTTATDKYISIEGEVTGDVLLTADANKSYLITGPIIVTDGATLTIDPAGEDMTIEAEPNFSAYILVAQGGQMFVNGTENAVVKFTTKVSNQIKYMNDPDAAKIHDRWGGLVVNGYAPIAGAISGTTSSTEVSASYKYGGSDEADFSGSYTYMWLDRTGAKSSASVEHNGLTLNGVGAATVIENVYITGANDDGVEFFGGNVNVTNLLVVDSDDDMFDFTQGYKGTLTNAYGVWTNDFYSDEKDPRGIEADGNLDGEGPSHVDQSDFIVKGITIDLRNDASVAKGYNDKGGKFNTVFKIRRGTKATISNALIKFGTNAATGALINFTDGAGNGSAATTINVTVDNDGSGNIGTYIDGATTEPTDNSTANGVTYNPTTPNTGASANAFDWTGFFVN